MLPQQLTLNVNLREGLRFDSYYAEQDSSNSQTVSILKAFVTSTEPQQNILWGTKQSGKTHLLQACCTLFCRDETHTQGGVSFIPLKIFKSYGPEVLTGLSQAELIVVDDVDIVLGEKDWETALFGLINATRENQQRLLFSCTPNPRKLDCILPDLASRLIWGGSYQLLPLDDEEKIKVLQIRAEQRGFELSDRVIAYLYRRYPRDIESLMKILNQLDEESLRQKTVITVPFVKQVLNKIDFP